LAESFGGCLALRLAAAAPHLVKALVLLNPATCYNQSLNGLSSFVSATNLLGLFPQDLYNTAQVGGTASALALLLFFLVSTCGPPPPTQHRWDTAWRGLFDKLQPPVTLFLI